MAEQICIYNELYNKYYVEYEKILKELGVILKV